VIKIASPNGDAIKKAYDLIHSIVAEPEVGQIYTGTVVKIVDFGAFVNFFGKRDGLVHVSQIEQRRLNHPSDVLKEGQEVKVKLLGFDDRGKVRLSMKVVDQETGAEIAQEEKGGDEGEGGENKKRRPRRRKSDED
jgi:polyribonucleotide nucleotidyltransferase